MAFHINIQDVYELGTTVSFWGTLDPTDASITLPSPEPFQIWQGSNLVYQPNGMAQDVMFPPCGRRPWYWDQRDNWSESVGAGLYTLKFFVKEFGNPICKDFNLSGSTKDILKSSAKWAKRGCVGTGPFVSLGAPVTGTIITVLALPFEMIENDPPDFDYQETTPVDAFNMDLLGTLDDPVLSALSTSGVKLGPLLNAIRITMERIEGAEIKKDETAIVKQQNHLDGLRIEAAYISRQIARAVGELSERYLHYRTQDVRDTSIWVQETAQGTGVSEFIRTIGGSAESLNRLLENSRHAVQPEDNIGELLKELQFNFDRFAESMSGSASPQAKAA